MSLSINAHAGFLLNEDLKSQLEGDRNRTLPKTDKFSMAVEAEVFQTSYGFGSSNDEEKDFYHGTGYWVPVRLEYQVSPETFVNLKSIFYSGTTSSGYGDRGTTGLLNFFGITYKPKTSLGDMYIRLIDLGRLTLGHGMFVDRKETSGAHFILKNGKTKYRLLFEGTGGVTSVGDLMYGEATINNDILGLAFYGVNNQGASGTLLPTVSIISTYRFLESTKYSAEIGGNKGGVGGVVFTETVKTHGAFQWMLKPQVRYYELGLMGKNAVLNRAYIDYAQNDMPDTNATSIFTEMKRHPGWNNLWVYATELNFDYKFNDTYSMYLNNEVNVRQYDNETKTVYYFKLATVIYPISNRDDAVTFYLTNKLLNTHIATDWTTGPDYVNWYADMFAKKFFGGVTVSLRF